MGTQSSHPRCIVQSSHTAGLAFAASAPHFTASTASACTLHLDDQTVFTAAYEHVRGMCAELHSHYQDMEKEHGEYIALDGKKSVYYCTSVKRDSCRTTSFRPPSYRPPPSHRRTTCTPPQ